MVAEGIELVCLPLGEQDVQVSALDLARLADAGTAAARFLTPRERSEYGSLRHAGRRSEWLGARVCLKAMLVSRGSVCDPLQCEVMKDARGRPWLSFAPGFPLSAVHDCSLSHKADLACACTSSVAGARVGVDVERVSSRLAKLTGAFVNERDARMPTLPTEVRLAVLWALKEACSKAVGLGIGIGLKDVICEEESEGRHNLRVDSGPRFRGRHLLHEGYVIALCLMEEETHVAVA